jgi:hypothetical protein
MRKLLLFSAVMLLVFGMLGRANAIPVTAEVLIDFTNFEWTYTEPPEDLDAYGGSYVLALEDEGDFLAYTHHFDFSFLEIYEATLTIAFDDDEDYDTWAGDEYATVSIEGSSMPAFEVQDANVEFVVLNSDVEDGMLAVVISAYGDEDPGYPLDNDFRVDWSSLEITYEPDPAPEPATLILFGSGALGLAAFRRKFRKR